MANQRISTQDATGTPIVSGNANSLAKTSLTVIVPQGYNRLKIKCSVPWRMGDNTYLDGAAALKGFFPLVANEVGVIPCVQAQSIYVKTAAGDAGDWYFLFYNSTEGD